MYSLILIYIYMYNLYMCKYGRRIVVASPIRPGMDLSARKIPIHRERLGGVKNGTARSY